MIKNKLLNKVVEVFLEIRDGKYGGEITRRTSCMYCTVSKSLKMFEEMGLVRREREGRVVRTLLTEKGKEVQRLLREIADSGI